MESQVIISRKGFDSAADGYASPILPDGRMVSLPIPDSKDHLKYSDLKLEKNISYYDLMKDLSPKIKNKESIELTKQTRCHCDPDIYKAIIKRKKGWRPSFGPIDGPQTHLERQMWQSITMVIN